MANNSIGSISANINLNIEAFRNECKRVATEMSATGRKISDAAKSGSVGVDKLSGGFNTAAAAAAKLGSVAPGELGKVASSVSDVAGQGSQLVGVLGVLGLSLTAIAPLIAVAAAAWVAYKVSAAHAEAESELFNESLEEQSRQLEKAVALHEGAADAGVKVGDLAKQWQKASDNVAEYQADLAANNQATSDTKSYERQRTALEAVARAQNQAIDGASDLAKAEDAAKLAASEHAEVTEKLTNNQLAQEAAMAANRKASQATAQARGKLAALQKDSDPLRMAATNAEDRDTYRKAIAGDKDALALAQKRAGVELSAAQAAAKAGGPHDREAQTRLNLATSAVAYLATLKDATEEVQAANDAEKSALKTQERQLRALKAEESSLVRQNELKLLSEGIAKRQVEIEKRKADAAWAAEDAANAERVQREKTAAMQERSSKRLAEHAAGWNTPKTTHMSNDEISRLAAGTSNGNRANRALELEQRAQEAEARGNFKLADKLRGQASVADSKVKRRDFDENGKAVDLQAIAGNQSMARKITGQVVAASKEAQRLAALPDAASHQGEIKRLNKFVQDRGRAVINAGFDSKELEGAMNNSQDANAANEARDAMKSLNDKFGQFYDFITSKLATP